MKRMFWVNYKLGGVAGLWLFVMFAAAGLWTLNGGTAHAGADGHWPPPGESHRFSISRDTSVSSVKGERKGGNGGASRVKLKGQQELVLFDFDTAPLKGKIITGARMHFRSASPSKAPLARVGVSSVASEWVEGTSRGYRAQKGSSCFEQAEYGIRDWAYPGSAVMDVVFGRGETIWGFSDCTAPDEEGWQSFAVSADVVAARVAGLSHGFSAFDEVGSTWAIQQGRFQYTHFPNRYVYTRESGRSGPWIEVWVNGEDKQPPEPVTGLSVSTEGLPPGEAIVRWKTPSDHGGGKVLGFHVSYARDGKESSIPRYLIPMAGQAGAEVLMHIKDLPLKGGEEVTLSLRAVDTSGNVSEPFTRRIKVAGSYGPLDIPMASVAPFKPDEALPTVGGVRVAVVDLLDKIDPKTGEIIPEAFPGYKGGNHIFSAQKRTVRLHAARNEHVAFQINFAGQAEDIHIECLFEEHPFLSPVFYEVGYVEVEDKGGGEKLFFPDPLIPMQSNTSVPSLSGQVQVPEQTNQVICEVYVPHKESAGEKTGKLVVRVGEESLEFRVILEVWNFTLPNKLSFIPEMNAYGTVSPNEKGYAYYRLAHEHRTCINRLPYNWGGRPAFAPRWDGVLKRLHFLEWERAVGPLLTGRAFRDMPRSGEPLDVFYLPFNENWPVSVYENYTPSYWADEAFSETYRDDLLSAFRSLAKHCDLRGWNDTVFQFFLNNKVFFRNRVVNSSAPWIFDEPVNTQDFWALRWYGLLWRQAVDPVRGEAKMWYRCDISHGDFGRDLLWGVMDLEYIGGNRPQKTRMKHDEQVRWPESRFSEYGSANSIAASNTFVPAWCLSAWARGAMGVLPWQTIGGRGSWKSADTNALFYPDENGPFPSIRLKAFRRGQQDVEYLTMFKALNNVPVHLLDDWLMQASGSRIGSKTVYSSTEEQRAAADISPQLLWQLRIRLGEALSMEAPLYKRSYVSWDSSSRALEEVPSLGYVKVSPPVEAVRPECDDFKPR